MNKSVDQFIKKLSQWPGEAAKLRKILLALGLEENFKWSLPCYANQGRNIAIIQPFKSCLGLMFFKGALIKDPKKILKNNGPNSRSAKRLEFRSEEEVTKLAAIVKAFVKEAIHIERSGQKVEVKKTPATLPAELKKMLAMDAKLKKAFAGLTPGRQRAYILHFAGAKQSATREARIAKCIPRIIAGKGLIDR